MTREELREWADEHGHTDDYAKCRACGNARQDCTCCDDDSVEASDHEDDEEDEE